MREKRMRVAKKRSYSFILPFAYCRLSIRILLLFYHILFLPHPEGAVGPIPSKNKQLNFN